MPCRPQERFAQGPEPPNPVTPTESTGNDGAGHADPDAENSDAESDLEAPQKQKRAHTVLSYEVVQRWVTGNRAVRDLLSKKFRLILKWKHAS